MKLYLIEMFLVEYIMVQATGYYIVIKKYIKLYQDPDAHRVLLSK